MIKTLERYPEPVSVRSDGHEPDAVQRVATTDPSPAPLGRTLRRTSSGAVVEAAAASKKRAAAEWLVVVVAAAATALIVRTSVLQMFFIPSESMAHTLEVDDKVMVDKVSHRINGVHRGDIVVFTRPANLQGTTVKDLVKRVIAVEGDTIEAVNGHVFVNDVAINEPYLVTQGVTRNLPRTTIGADQLFMMGDNRERSSDSRVFGPIPESSVVGHARAIVLRHGRLHLETP